MTPSPPENSGMPPPPLYALPPRSAGLPLWGKLFIGCGILFLLFLVLIGPGLTRMTVARQGGIQTQYCLDNLRAIHTGFALYSQDYDQKLPQAAVWMDTTTPYVKQHTDFKCPVVRVSNPKGFGYAFNSKLSGSATAKITTPETTAMVYDSSNLERNASDALTSLPVPTRHSLLRTRAARNAPRKGNLILYADGHVLFVGQDSTSVDISRMKMRRTLFTPPIKQNK